MTSIAPAVNAFPVMAASGTISRGKRTFVTRLAFATRLRDASCTPPRKNVQTVRPTKRNSA